DQRRGDAAHRIDVGGGGRDGLAADVRGGGPVPTEVPTLDEDVRRGDVGAVGGGDVRRIVAGGDQHVVTGPQRLAHHVDQRELTDLRDGLLAHHGVIVAVDEPGSGD